MREEEELFIKNTSKAIEENNSKLLQEEVSNFSEFCFKEPPEVIYDDTPITNEFIQELSDIIRNKDFLKMDGSYYLFSLFQNDWGRFTEKQKSAISQLLSDVYDKITDHTSNLIISEIFSEYLPEEEGLASLLNAKKSTSKAARAYAIEGLKKLARNSKKTSVKEKVNQALSDI